MCVCVCVSVCVLVKLLINTWHCLLMAKPLFHTRARAHARKHTNRHSHTCIHKHTQLHMHKNLGFIRPLMLTQALELHVSKALVRRAGQNHIYIRCIYGVFGREITKNTVIYGVYTRFWPTLRVRSHAHDQDVSTCASKASRHLHLNDGD